jgi:hypothetical protein
MCEVTTLFKFHLGWCLARELKQHLPGFSYLVNPSYNDPRYLISAVSLRISFPIRHYESPFSLEHKSRMELANVLQRYAYPLETSHEPEYCIPPCCLDIRLVHESER